MSMVSDQDANDPDEQLRSQLRALRDEGDGKVMETGVFNTLLSEKMAARKKIDVAEAKQMKKTEVQVGLKLMRRGMSSVQR